jgi:D-proline reductase (dithiol) PrdB
MARLKDFPEPMRSHLVNLHCPSYENHPWVSGPSLSHRRVSIISTAGLHRRGDRTFESISGDYRIIPGDIQAKDLVVTHVSTNFDRTGFQQDWNMVFPLDRLREMADKKIIGTVADYHYSFMGAVDPATMAPATRNLAGLLKQDAVDAALLVPV